jgi:hypothetical protein
MRGDVALQREPAPQRCVSLQCGGDARDATERGDARDATERGDARDATERGDTRDATERGDARDATERSHRTEATAYTIERDIDIRACTWRILRRL